MNLPIPQKELPVRSIGHLPLLSKIVLSALCLSFGATAAEPNNSPPTAYIGGYVNSSKPLFVYEEILLVGMGEDPDGDALNYAWDFGDGTAGIGEMVYHRYPKTGSYTVVLTVSDGNSQAKDQRTLELRYQSIVSYPSVPSGDTQIVRTSENLNYGGTDSMYVYNGEYPDYRALLGFDIGSRPSLPSDDALYLGSFLELSCLEGNEASPKTQVFALTRSWVEGNGSASGDSGANWKTYDGAHEWKTAGGDYDAAADFGYGANGVAAEAYVRDTGARVSYDLTALVDAWWSGALPNYGLLMGVSPDVYYKRVEFASSEFTDSALRPTLDHKYTVGNFARNAEATQDFQSWLKTLNTQATITDEGGDKTFKITKSSPEGSLYQQIDLSKVDGIDDETLRLEASAQMRAEIENADGGFPFLKVQIYDKNGVLLDEGSTPQTNSTAWARQSVSLPIPAGAGMVVVSLKRSPTPRRGASNSGAYFDSISLSLSQIE